MTLVCLINQFGEFLINNLRLLKLKKLNCIVKTSPQYNSDSFHEREICTDITHMIESYFHLY